MSVIEIEATVTLSIFILFAMGCVTAALSLLFYRKTRTLDQLSKKVNATFFNRTFNIMDPYEGSRKTINSIVAWPIALMIVFAFIAIAFPTLFGFGLALGFVILIGSIGLMMVDEATEINTSANHFKKAIDNQTAFGKGDVVALHLLRRTMPKLKNYYILLTTLFISSAVILPYVLQAVLTGFTESLGSLIATTSTLGVLSPYLTLLIFTAVVTIITLTAGRIKTKAFGLGPSPTLTSIEEQFERITIMAKWGEAPPFELSHRPVLEDPEVEERKRKALDPQE